MQTTSLFSTIPLFNFLSLHLIHLNFQLEIFPFLSSPSRPPPLSLPTKRPNRPDVVKAMGSLDRFGPFLVHFSSLQSSFSSTKINSLTNGPFIPNYSQNFVRFSSGCIYDPFYPPSHIVDNNTLYL